MTLPADDKADRTVVGVTGKYCAGKNAVCAVLKEMGFSIIDVDRLGHAALGETRERIAERFGSSVIGMDGDVDRRALGDLVFGDPEALAVLEAIVHPVMVEEVKNIVAESAAARICINAAILHRMGLHVLCTWIIWVTAPFTVRLRRAMKRDGLTIPQAVRRIVSQRQLSLQSLPHTVDIYTIRNRGSAASLTERVRETLAWKGLR